MKSQQMREPDARSPSQHDDGAPSVAVLGLGEAGRLFAEGLSGNGVVVRGFDPYLTDSPLNVHMTGSIAEAVESAGLVVSLVGSRSSEGVAAEAFDAMETSAVFADLNSSGPDQKRAIAAKASEHGVLFADVAVMAPVPRAGIHTPLLASGTGAERAIELFGAVGISVDFVGQEAGAAAGMKMLRSIFMKGLAALVFESVTAAEKSGGGAWIQSEIASELGPDGPALVQRLMEGTVAHAQRRELEMHDVAHYLEELDIPHWMTDASILWLARIAAE